MNGKSAADIQEIYDGMATRWGWVSISDRFSGFNWLRRKHLAAARGDVLDVACGTGENFRYLKGAASVTAIDLSPEMARLAEQRARRLGLQATVIVADAAALPYQDHSFDTVVSAGSSCTFPNYIQAFKEMERVAKPDGRILLVEHSRSSVGWIARRQDRKVDKTYEKWGCRTNRDLVAELAEAGLKVVSYQRSHLGMLNRVEIHLG